ncbi:MAG: adenylyl-sulfate kinase [Bacteroidetes bacterium]|nr:adenylyl-sulfate kinase [Bacteroidota bacterium]
MNLIISDMFPVGRPDKEKHLNQKARAIWMTGLSGSGKSTIGLELERALYNRGYLVQLLDGDIVRTGINSNLKFSVEDRMENIRRIAEVTRLFLQCGIITIDCFISPTHEIRAMAKEIIGPADFIEVFVDASLETCENRDVKGLYAKARKGLIMDFTGISSPFEAPINPDLVLNTMEMDVETTVHKALDFILPQIILNV